ncbi:hypothetical protein PHJA_002836800 [Phtheirospermum japonicum]|uniref:Uncharacterized protein n=1 Tax=Phtheirospermum japonicum TaxID=374723 RepID=A0A830D2V1_9LAMI|nr:hypothetical protein PHJA_002836800 [Phtheirospermum japonicum]
MEPIESTHKIQSHAIKIEEEEDGDLFEINLEIVNKIPPPHYWDSYFTSTSNTLLANCLLPIADVSSAVPMVMRACDALLPWPATGEDQLAASSKGVSMLHYKEMKV